MDRKAGEFRHFIRHGVLIRFADYVISEEAKAGSSRSVLTGRVRSALQRGQANRAVARRPVAAFPDRARVSEDYYSPSNPLRGSSRRPSSAGASAWRCSLPSLRRL